MTVPTTSGLPAQAGSGRADHLATTDGPVPVTEAPVGVLLARAGGGDQTAWDELVRRYNRLVWSVARSFRLSTPDAADVVQTTWLRLVEHLTAIQDADRLGAWLATTARRESLRIARQRRRELGDGADDDLAQLPAEGVGVEDALLRSERDALLHRAVRSLDDRCQSLLRVLSASPPPRYDAVAEAFGMPIGSIGPTRGRCLKRLRDSLDALGWELDAGPAAGPAGGAS